MRVCYHVFLSDEYILIRAETKVEMLPSAIKWYEALENFFMQLAMRVLVVV